jgi:hypothetical protein
MPVMPPRAVAGALEQARQRGEHGGRIALGRGRLADGQADLAPGHRHARHGVDHEQHLLALVAEVLGDRGGHERAAGPHQRGLVAGRHDHHGARQPSSPSELSMKSRTSRPRSPSSAITFTSALRLPRDHAEQRALAHAAAREDAHALAAPSVSSPSIARTPVSSGCGR